MINRILVVDNHPVILKFMINLLTKRGYEVKTAKDGLSALDTLKTYIPDVIFVDLVMPNISGEKLCRIIRSLPNLEDVYLIVLSGIAAEGKINFAELGANAFIAKGPLSIMAERIFSALDQAGPGVTRERLGERAEFDHYYPREVVKELLSSIKHLEGILENMSEGVLELTYEPKIVYANPAALSLMGIPEEKLLGSIFTDFLPDTDRDRIESLLLSHSSKPRETYEDLSLVLNDKQVLLNILPVEGEEHVVVIMKDITERKRMEAQLQRAHKMEAMGTLAGGIAHDFNNLLMGIQGNASIMLLDVDSTYPHHKNLKNIEILVQSGSKLTKQLLGYARKGRYEIKAINMSQLVEQTSDTFGRTRKEITIHRDFAEDLFSIEADQGQMEQLLLNLYVNAWQAMPGNGELFLKTGNTTDQDIKDKLYKPKPGKYVSLAITDTGVGMDKETQKRIFDPFFTTKEMGRGVGLGLASVYGIVKGHGGYIDVESEKGRGTTFNIYIPASGKAVTEEKELARDILKGSETVLLVDDEEMITEVAEEMLKMMGYKVFVANNSEEAVSTYLANKDKIDLIILDMIMPDVGGGKTYDLLREVDPDVKVLLCSGYSISGLATEIMERGCDGFIQKPFDIKLLSRKLREILTSAHP